MSTKDKIVFTMIATLVIYTYLFAIGFLFKMAYSLYFDGAIPWTSW